MGGNLTDDLQNWAISASDVKDLLHSDDYNVAVFGRGTWPGYNLTDPAAVEMQLPSRLPGTNGYYRNVSNGGFCDSCAHLESSNVFCEDAPGPTGHHCFKLVHGPSAGWPLDYNESLWTVSQETGVPVSYFVSKYNLSNPDFIHVVTALEVPNSPVPPGPAPPSTVELWCNYKPSGTSSGGVSCPYGCADWAHLQADG